MPLLTGVTDHRSAPAGSRKTSTWSGRRRHPRCPTSWHTAPTSHARERLPFSPDPAPAPARSAHSRRDVGGVELPLVVAGPPHVGTDRGLFALALNAHNSWLIDAGDLRLRLRLRLVPSAWTLGLGRQAREQQLELAVLGHRILVFLPEVPALHEDVEAWGKGADRKSTRLNSSHSQ